MIKELAKYIKQYKKYAILTPLMVVLEIVMEVVIPYLMARIIDVGIQNNDLDYIILYPVSSFLQYKRECALVHRIF